MSKSVCCLLQRCTYASCNCDKSEACLCAVLSSYARACAAKGVFLTDWRNHVCGKEDFFGEISSGAGCTCQYIFSYNVWKNHFSVVHKTERYTRSCPSSQTFSYKHQRCQLTCRSLSSEQPSCTADFLPVDGCSCAEGLYQDDHGTCIPQAKCPCYHNEVHIKPGKSIMIKDEHWLVAVPVPVLFYYYLYWSISSAGHKCLFWKCLSVLFFISCVLF